jgi:hypothetical protein
VGSHYGPLESAALSEVGSHIRDNYEKWVKKHNEEFYPEDEDSHGGSDHSDHSGSSDNIGGSSGGGSDNGGSSGGGDDN